ncbi:hypothetical protein DMB66_33785 [Actinoplanes sp. ATCC 53533]|uniref:hypothetical protein n=1 Tax=Actinoplanes sp. ATCC 53533 TaxID=1288362 RepID=UPI000F7A815C|nr:hypothetical protein [Actinoplanes sp. ATCC 53533]RSM56666.1 hypothetical protein DMB66_33785 [Actinoplanes sp. ATCC 53533]
MSRHPDLDDLDASALLSPLAGEPAGPSRIDVARAMAEGRRRRRTRWWTSGVAVVVLTATSAAGGTLAFSAAGRPTPAPSRPIASPAPSIAASPAGPRDCTVTRLPTDGIRKAVVTGGDSSGRWQIGRTYPPGRGQAQQLVVWKDGELVDEIKIDGSNPSLQDINSRGDVVGVVDERPYAYSAGRTTRLAGGAGSAAAINDAGVVVGSLGSGSGNRPVRWSSVTARPQRLPMPAGSSPGVAVDVDEAGNVLGAIDIEGKEGTGYLWLADGTARLMPMPEMDGRRADLFWPAAIRNGWVVGQGAVGTPNPTALAFFRYQIATNRYERLPTASGVPTRVAANGWVLGEAELPVITNAAGATTVLPRYPKAQGRQDYLVTSYSDDGLSAAGYAVGTDLQNQPLLWRCR